MTVCSEKRIDQVKAEAYIKANPLMFPDEMAKEKGRDFIKRLSTISFETMDEFPLDIDPGINPENYLELMNDLKVTS